MAIVNIVHPKTEDMESHQATANLKRATIKIIVVIKYVQLRIRKSIEGIRQSKHFFWYGCRMFNYYRRKENSCFAIIGTKKGKYQFHNYLVLNVLIN